MAVVWPFVPVLSYPRHSVCDMAFTDTDLEMLRLAGAPYRHEANRVQAARERFDLGEVAFYARVNALLDDPAAELAEPMIVHRLRRLRGARFQQRAPRRAS